MYQRADIFLSDEATVKVSRGDADYTDVMIHIRDPKASFNLSVFMSYREMQHFVGDYWAGEYHSCFYFFKDGLSVYDKVGGKMDDLKFTLEML